ncbi:hypothetical protein GCM10018987_17900 [Streptomyces cremeus]
MCRPTGSALGSASATSQQNTTGKKRRAQRRSAAELTGTGVRQVRHAVAGLVTRGLAGLRRDVRGE